MEGCTAPASEDLQTIPPESWRLEDQRCWTQRQAAFHFYSQLTSFFFCFKMWSCFFLMPWSTCECKKALVDVEAQLSSSTNTYLMCFTVSHLYGFGLVDAEAMVLEAMKWRTVPPQHTCSQTPERQTRWEQPSSGAVIKKILFQESIMWEWSEDMNSSLRNESDNSTACCCATFILNDKIVFQPY